MMQSTVEVGLLSVVFLLLIKHQGHSQNVQNADIISSTTNTHIKIGQDVTLTCKTNMAALMGGFRVGWVKADTKAIQAIGNTLITNNMRIKVKQEKGVVHHLVIINATLNDDGPYRCQLSTTPMKSQMHFLYVHQPEFRVGVKKSYISRNFPWHLLISALMWIPIH